MNNKLKLAAMDFSGQIFKWTLWYLPIMLIIYILVSIFINEQDINEMSFYAMALSANEIFMLVAGILSVFMFLELSVSLGLTRRTFLRAMLLTGGIITIALAAMTGIISVIMNFMPWFGGSIVVGDLESGPLVHILGHLLTTFTFFLGGFIISIGFYRGFLGGMISIVLSLCILVAIDSLWMWQTRGTVFDIDVTPYASGNLFMTIVFSLFLIFFTVAILQSLIRSVPVKVK
ncbi:hypothetical protein ACFOLA_06575 [Salinicoccus hispanicus]|uniref:Uncharacterized protein n=1 Tax=Salinicoccus hispanicus TaxID=157225 RepID=A0A6N8U713_9STAP|nr:hypothetical protein [Salinicoccus hispanicus]MXQ51429.1 hypothetical protein [Salinicoccus hispanicus]